MDSLLESDLFKTYAIHVCFLTLKMQYLVVKTILTRLKNKAYHTPEDAIYLKSPMKTDDNVERIRKCHLNGVENSYLFVFVAFLYLTTRPDPLLAKWLFRSHTITRFLHTFVYTICIVRQPARAYTWLVGFIINGFMAIAVIHHYFNHL